MSDWIVTDGTGTTIHIPPIPEGLVAAGWLLVAAVVMVVVLWVLNVNLSEKPGRVWRTCKRLLQKHYLSVFLFVGGGVFAWVLVVYPWKIVGIVSDMIETMEVGDPTEDKTQTRNVALAIAAFAGMLAVFSTVPFRLVRAWINERTAKTQEATHITGLINDAVESLGAEKTIERIGRVLRYRDEPEGRVQKVLEWEDDENRSDLPAGLIDEPGDWQSFRVTRPNLEVRIGAILTLERIARDNPDDHIRVMDILCAYIRENSKAEDAPEPFVDAWPEYPEEPTREDLAARKDTLVERRQLIAAWVKQLRPARTDIQMALEVIGNRSPELIDSVEAKFKRGGAKRYRIDLRKTNLQKINLTDLNFSHALFDGARLEGANLSLARMDSAHLIEARMEGADLTQVRMNGAILLNARMENSKPFIAELKKANLSRARLEGANLTCAQMQGAICRKSIFTGAEMKGAELSGAKMQSAQLCLAEMERVNLERAVLTEAKLWNTKLIASNTRRADLRSVDFYDTFAALIARSTDFRGARNLYQCQLDHMIGDEWTLLPKGNSPDTGEAYSIASCWVEAPPYLELIVQLCWELSGGQRNREKIREEFLCAYGEAVRYSNSLAVDEPYPPEHPLAERD